jgi:hypothetical protein
MNSVAPKAGAHQVGSQTQICGFLRTGRNDFD